MTDILSTVYGVTSKTESLSLKSSHFNGECFHFSIQTALEGVVMKCTNFKHILISASDSSHRVRTSDNRLKLQHLDEWRTIAKSSQSLGRERNRRKESEMVREGLTF